MCLLISCEDEGLCRLDQAKIEDLTVGPRMTLDFQASRRDSSVFRKDGIFNDFTECLSKHCEPAELTSPWDPTWIDLHRYRGNTHVHSAAESIAQDYDQRLSMAAQGLIVRHGFAVHLSLRTFPQWRRKGGPARTDIGLLYDNERSDEQNLAIDWVDEVYCRSVDLRVRRNYPSRGNSAPCVTRRMRKRFADMPYIGIGVWFNSRWATRSNRRRTEAIHLLARSLITTLRDGGLLDLPTRAA